VEKLSEAQALTMPQSSDFLEGVGSVSGSGASGGSTNARTPFLSNFLKVVPLQEKKVSCAVRLSNSETVRLNFILKREIERPIVELKSFYGEKSGAKEDRGYLPFEYQEAITIFKNFVMGGRPTSFRDLSPGDLRATTEGFRYRVLYYGSDQHYAGFVIEVSGKKDQKQIPKLKSVKLGEVFFSALVEEDEKGNRKSPRIIVKDKNYFFYILARADLSLREMIGELP
jgi:hypothetical protein